MVKLRVNPLLFIVYFAAILPTLLLLIWIYVGLEDNYSGLSFSWECDDPDCVSGPIWQTFNWHPLLMCAAFGTFVTQAISAYKLMPFDFNTNKLIHMSLQTIALVLSITGFTVITVFKKRSQNYNFYSLHSWLGLLVLVFFIFQYLGGFIAFLFPKLSPEIRKHFGPFHIYFGMSIYILSLITISTGIADRQLICGWGNCGMSTDVYTYNWIGANLVIIFLIIAGALAFWAQKPPTNLTLYAYKKEDDLLENLRNNVNE